MANESPRLTTADLRRRLHSPASSVAALPRPELPPLKRSTGVKDFPSLETLIIEDVALKLDLDDLGSSGDLPDLSAYAIAPAPQLASSRSSATNLRQPNLTTPVAVPAPEMPNTSASEEALRQENEQLQQLLEEMQHLLQDASEQDARHQKVLEEKDLVIAKLKERMSELEAQAANKPKSREELEEWSDDLEKESFKITQERRALDDDRRQIREDEKSLEKQMREMEVGMARERAMLARQEQDLKRLNAEIQHELEAMQRGDGALRDRLAVFQRRHSEVMGNGQGAAMPVPVESSHSGFMQSPVAQSAHPTPTSKKSDTTGLLRKMFRGRD